MSVTYTEDTVATRGEDDYVPTYARRSVKQKKVKTWMILAPIAAVALIGGGALTVMNSGGDTAPLVEPATPVAMAPIVTPPIVTPTTTPTAPMVATPEPALVTPVATPAPTVRQSEPARRASAPAVRRDATPARTTPTPRVAAPVEATGPRPYNASPMVAAPSLNTSPAPVTAPAPAITVQPLN